MIISHRLQFAFFATPRTGTTTVQFMLWLSGVFDSGDIVPAVSMFGFSGFGIPDGSAWDHLNPQEAIDLGLITEAQCVAYNCVATLREPLDRYRSSHAAYVFQTGGVQAEIKRHGNLGILDKPAAAYFTVGTTQVCQPMHFDDFDNELRRVIAEIGGPVFPIIPKLRITANQNLVPSDYLDAESQALVAAAIQPDIDFYRSLRAA